MKKIFTHKKYPNFSGIYEVSSDGTYAINTETDCPCVVRKYRHELWLDLVGKDGGKITIRLSTLILLTFNGAGYAIDKKAMYKDGDPNNVHLDNLQWGYESNIQIKEKKWRYNGPPRKKGVPKRNILGMSDIQFRIIDMQHDLKSGIPIETIAKYYQCSVKFITKHVHFEK